MMIRIIPSLALIGLLGGCSSTVKEPPVSPSPPTTEATAQPAQKPGDDPSQSQISISDDIRKACGLSTDDAYFAFNSASVTHHDHDILGKVARCFLSGPLAGKEMKLVGHADPRGEAEYNMVLGGHRADNVRSFIAAEGLPSQRMTTSSRGALDATGTDEAGWSKDRRVDMLLGG